MCDKLVHRFDRRPDPRFSVDGLIFNQAVPSQDSYMREISLEAEDESSECEIELTLDGKVDLINVIAVCYAISHDSSARDYTLFQHNCFFFSWTILTIVSRHHLPYEVPMLQPVLCRFNSDLEGLTSLLVDEATALFLDLAIETFVIFLRRVRTSAPEGRGLIMGRAGSMFPTNLIRFLGRRLFKLHLFFGLRGRLTKTVKAELTRGASIVHGVALNMNLRGLLDKHLWVEGTKDTIREKLGKEIDRILWKCILEALSGGLGTVEPEHLQDQLTNPELNFTWLGQDVAEICTVCSAILRGGLVAVGKAGQDVEGLLHHDAFDKAWNAARDATLTAAQNAVNITRVIIQKPERDAKWAAIWGIWDDCWREAHGIAQPKAVQTVERVVEEILAAATGVIIQEVKEYRAETIQAYVPAQASSPQCSSI